MAYLPTNVAAGQAGHVGHTNLLHGLYNAGYAGDATSVINVQSPPSTITGTGAVGDGTTDDTDAIQAVLDWCIGSRAANHIVWFPFRNASGAVATYLVSAPLRVWTQTALVGGTGKRGSTIRASSSFDWVTHPYSAHPNYQPAGNSQPGNIALIEAWNNATSRGGSSRIFINAITLVGNVSAGAVAAGSIGFWGKQQQNSHIIDLRCDDFETGFVTWGQQGKMERLQIGTEQADGIKVGVYLGADFAGDGVFGVDAAKFFKFEELNVEYYTEAAVRMHCDGPNWFEDSHFENLHSPVTATALVLDCKSGEFTMDQTWSTHIGDGVIVVGDLDPVPEPIKANYSIRNWRNSDIGTAVTFMDDRVRNKTRMIGHQRLVRQLDGGFQNDTQADYDAALVQWWGDEGAEIRMGGVKGGTSAPSGHTGAQFTFRANTNQDEPMGRFLDTSGNLRSGVHQSGNLFLATFNNTTRPAANTVVAGTMIFNTDDNAPNFSDGTNWRDAAGVVT